MYLQQLRVEVQLMICLICQNCLSRKTRLGLGQGKHTMNREEWDVHSLTFLILSLSWHWAMEFSYTFFAGNNKLEVYGKNILVFFKMTRWIKQIEQN